MPTGAPVNAEAAEARATEVRPRVLVVDDEPAFAEAVAELLEGSGFDAHSCSDPEEALRRTGAERFEVALLDIGMPRMDGFELAERVRELSPTTQVIILTGRDDVEAARGGMHVGAYDFLMKSSFNAAAIEGTVRAAAQKSRTERAQAALTQKVGQANRLMAALHGLGATDRDLLDTKVVLERLVAAAKELAGAEVGRALLFAPTHNEEGLVVEEAVGDGAEPLRGGRLGPSEGIAAFAAMVGEGVTLARATDHPRYSHRCDEVTGAHPGFLCVPLRSGPVRGALILASHADGAFPAEAVTASERLAAQAALHLDNLLGRDRSANFFTHVSEILVSILNSQDLFNQGHSRMVATLADMMTRRLGLSDHERRRVHYAALLCDIGKTRIHPSLLNTIGRYQPEARRQMEAHTVLGVEMLKPITLFAELLPLIHSHHERWDGKGYPAGLAGEDIPLGARVIAVADAFDAMTHGRPYAPAKTPEDALGELEKGAGTQFDAQIVAFFVEDYREHREELRP
jgi:putative nucleotidyltransferase with HDIG domain